MTNESDETRLKLLEETRVTREQGDTYWAGIHTQKFVYALIALFGTLVVTVIAGLLLRWVAK
jgi:hypothetical protein